MFEFYIELANFVFIGIHNDLKFLKENGVFPEEGLEVIHLKHEEMKKEFNEKHGWFDTDDR